LQRTTHAYSINYCSRWLHDDAADLQSVAFSGGARATVRRVLSITPSRNAPARRVARLCTALQHGRMDHEEVGRCWDENAEVWTELVRAGYDFYRDGLNTPAFLAMLPETRVLSGLDIGCGEERNTGLLAERGARMVEIDTSPATSCGTRGRQKRSLRPASSSSLADSAILRAPRLPQLPLRAWAVRSSVAASPASEAPRRAARRTGTSS
jgi:hypothetical protein